MKALARSIGSACHNEERLVLQGVDSGRRWSAVIDPDGRLSIAAIDSDEGFIIFGECVARFRTRCRDYVDAVEALGRWEGSPSPTRETQGCIAEYRTLVKNLGHELLRELYRSRNS
jgi:hypothetical protein